MRLNPYMKFLTMYSHGTSKKEPRKHKQQSKIMPKHLPKINALKAKDKILLSQQ